MSGESHPSRSKSSAPVNGQKKPKRGRRVKQPEPTNSPASSSWDEDDGCSSRRMDRSAKKSSRPFKIKDPYVNASSRDSPIQSSNHRKDSRQVQTTQQTTGGTVSKKRKHREAGLMSTAVTQERVKRLHGGDGEGCTGTLHRDGMFVKQDRLCLDFSE